MVAERGKIADATQIAKEPKNYRTVSEAFEELKQARSRFETENIIKKPKHHKAKKKTYDVYYSGSIKQKNSKTKAINQDRLSIKEWCKYRINKLRYDKKEIRKLAFVTAGAFALCVGIISTNYIFAESRKEEIIKQKIATNVFETNKQALDIQKIVIDNVGITKSKTIIEDEPREVPYNVQRQENPNLPKGEEVIVQEGVFGTKLVDCVKSYIDNQYIEQKILHEDIIVQPITEIIDVGTSEFLAEYNVHLGEKMYVTETLGLKKEPSETSENYCIILNTLDVELLELGEEWLKVKYENYEGYIPANKVTSEYVTPGISEKSRTQKLYSTLDPNMDLTKPSGLTLEDYKKILSNNYLDTYKVIEENAENFYNAEQKYGINGIFLASIAIHESAWGTSYIARDKKNLFGFGAYDRDPYGMANTFEDYSKGIDDVAKYLVKNYLNKAGTEIFDGEIATGIYYNQPTLAGVNTKYCTDKEWSTKLYKYMDMLYSKLGETNEN